MLDGLALAALNHLLASAAGASARLAPFAGKTLRIDAAPFCLALVVDNDGLFTETGSTVLDVVIELPAGVAPILPGRAGKIFGEARISGPAGFTETLGSVLRNLRWDFEEDLGYLVGDIAAHRFAVGIHRLSTWQKDVARRAGENVDEYLATERGGILANPEVNAFSIEIASLCSSVDALEKRIDAFAR